MASINDKITDVRNAARPNSTTVSSPRSSGGTSLSCTLLTGWPTASKVHFVTYQIDSNSEPVSGTQLDCYGIVSGNTIGSFAVVDGTDTGNSVGDVVEMLPTAAWAQDLADALTTSLNRSGTVKDGAISAAAMLASDVVTTAKILDSNVTTAKIADANVTYTKLLTTVFSGQISTQANAGTAGGTMSYINLGGIKLLWCIGASGKSVGASAISYTFTLPSSFFSTITFATSDSINQATLGEIYSDVSSATTTTVTVKGVSPGGAASTGFTILVIGT